MKKIVLAGAVLLLSACAGIQPPEQTHVTVASLLQQIQIAVNEISAETAGSSLPPFQSAQIKLSTTASETSQGGASLVVTAGGSSTTSSSNTLTLELEPNPNKVYTLSSDVGQKIAKSVVAAVAAVDQSKFLKLKTLTVEAGLDVKQNKEGGLEVTLVGITFNGKRSTESSTGNTLTLTFAYPDKK